MDPIPPPSLNTELTSIWTGWRTLRDREVVREAAAKGSHISLAHKFIASRNQWELSEAEKWFEAQVRYWALELLNMRQVFKATHILTNISLDPCKEFTDTLLETKDKDLRDFLATHLIKIKKLETKLQDHWILMRLVQNNADGVHSIGNLSEDYKNFTLKDFLNFEADWKTKVATALFFSLNDNSVLPFLESNEAWRYLLIQNEITVLHDWIHKSYSTGFNNYLFNTDNPDFLITLHDLFTKWKITKEMISEIDTIVVSNFTKEYILNQLSVYGIFTEKTIPNIISALSKVEKIPQINEILSLGTSSLSVEEFVKMFIEFCTKCDLFNTIVKYLNDYEFSYEFLQSLSSKDIELWLSIRDLKKNRNDTEFINNCIIKACKLLSHNYLDSYLAENLEIFLGLILFDKNTSLQSVLLSNTKITINGHEFETINRDKIFKRFSVIENVVQKLELKFYKQDITLYQLLTNYLQIDFSQVFYFRYKNNDQLPNFSSDRLIQRFGHREKLTFTYYLKKGRPSIASKVFIIDNFKKYGKLTNKMKYIGANLAHAIAIQHFLDKGISSACISFVELIGVSSDLLRVHINIANLLSNSASFNEVIELFKNLSENKQKVLDLLEKEVIKNNLILNVNQETITIILTSWEVAIKFAKLHHLKYPESFLNYCLKENLWLEFLIYSQYHSYPIEQILKLAQKFINKVIAEHLSHAIAFDLKVTPEIFNEKKQNNSIVTKLPIIDNPIPNGSLIKEINEHSSSNDEEVYCDYYVENLDFIQVLCRCHKMKNPFNALIDAAKEYQNPNFIVFASFYEPEYLIYCWLVWICISIESQELMLQFNMENITPQLVINVLQNAVQKNFLATLAESFLIFLPENPLCSLTSFLNQYSNQLEKSESIKSLKLFKTVIKYMKYNNDSNKMDTTVTFLSFLTSRSWLSEVAVKLVSYTLVYCLNSQYSQELFLELLIDENFTEDLLTICPDFYHSKLLLNLLSNIDIIINMEPIMKLNHCSDSDKEMELQRCVNELIQMKDFNTALQLCKLEFLSTDCVIIEKWKHEFETRTNTEEFWKKCENALRQSKVNGLSAAKFFINMADQITDKLEKYIVLTIAFEWLKEWDIDNIEIQNVELEKWWLYINIDDWGDYPMEFTEEPCLKIVSSEIRRQSKISTLTVSRALSTQKQKDNFENLIGKLLDNGQIVQATRLEHMFGYKTQHLALIETCMKLAENELSPHSLSSEYHSLLGSFINRSKRRTLSSACLSNSASSTEMTTYASPTKDSQPLSDTQSVLESLTQQVGRGTCLAGRVLCCSRISQATSRPYARILSNYDAQALLKLTLTGDFDNKLELANDIMVYHSWNKHQVCEFLCAELISSISKYVFKESVIIEPIHLWGYPLEGTMHVVLELCPEPSILGTSLLVHATAPLSSTSRSALCLAGELLIRAHDCFTADCNMEGISKVLMKTRTLVSQLTTLHAWAPIVRLLTGLGRYAEMDYVFQILQENEQFEWLLGQGTARAVGLRGATMDYLRRRCPGRRELSRLVALRWGLHDSAAELWEHEAKELMSNVVNVAKLEMQNLGKVPGPCGIIEICATDEPTKKVLENAMSCLMHAVQHHLLSDRHTAAQKTTRTAELVALQLGLMVSSNSDRTVCILLINEAQYMYLIANVLNFCEAKILSTVYPNYQTDWAQVLYNHCIVDNNYDKYLPSFLSNYQMTDVLAKDVVRRYLSDQKSDQNFIPLGMKAILDAVQSAATKYRLASELGLKDVLQNLLDDPVTPYLKDTVWKTGCPAPNT